MTFCAFIPEHSGHVMVCVVNLVHVALNIVFASSTISIATSWAFPVAHKVFPNFAKDPRGFDRTRLFRLV